jgi:hypothetical protein
VFRQRGGPRDAKLLHLQPCKASVVDVLKEHEPVAGFFVFFFFSLSFSLSLSLSLSFIFFIGVFSQCTMEKSVHSLCFSVIRPGFPCVAP